MASGIMNISLSALNAALSGMQTVQHNIANANTEGYHRQVLSFKATTPQYAGGGFFGTGVQAETARRLYDDFLSSQTRSYQAQLSSSEAYSTFSTQVDALLGGASSGLSQPMQAFFNSINEVANDPTSLVARQQMLSAGGNLASRFNILSDGLQDIKSAINKDVTALATRVNTLAGQIQGLNVQISRASSTGQMPNDLLDQREQLVAELNKLVGVTQSDQGDGTISVRLARGQALVDGISVRKLVPVNDPLDPTQTTLALEVPGSLTTEVIPESDITGGRIGGLFAFRTDVLNASIDDLNLMAQSLADTFNAQHAAGYDLNGDPGLDFFSYNPAAPAGTLSVALGQSSLIAAASVSPGVGDNSNAVALAAIQGQAIVAGTSTLAEYNGSMVGRNASYANSADTDVSMYSMLYKQSYDSLQSVSGVNLDEEAVDLIRYQQAYQAAAKAIQTSSELFNTVLGIMQ